MEDKKQKFNEAYYKNYYQANKEEISKKRKAHYQANREYILQRQNNYYRTKKANSNLIENSNQNT